MKRLFSALFAATILCATPFTVQADPDSIYDAYDKAVKRGIRSGFAGFPLGAERYTTWFDAETLQKGDKVPALKKGDKLTLYRFSGKIGEGTVTSVEKDVQDTIMYTIKGDNGKQYGVGTPILATDNPLDAMPRRMEKLSNNNPVYLDIVRKVLEKKGLKGVKPKIVQLFRGQLGITGHSYNDIVIVASNIPPQQGGDAAWNADSEFPSYGVMPAANPKSYSMVIVRQIVDGSVKEYILDSYISLKGSSPEKIDWQPPHIHKIEAFADINADGNMEIILTDLMYEGVGYNVYYHDSKGWRCVLSNGYGA